MQRLVVTDSGAVFSLWIEAQQGRYRYLTSVGDEDVVVRMVISEYLACEVVWSRA